jgi:hypothetical protein
MLLTHSDLARNALGYPCIPSIFAKEGGFVLQYRISECWWDFLYLCVNPFFIRPEKYENYCLTVTEISKAMPNPVLHLKFMTTGI